MVKEEIQVEDVEEGEISDTASIEEISEQDFNKQDAKDSTKEVSKPKAEAARVWTMQDLYRYQVEKGYTSGLHNLAWAQAVQKKKPLCEVATAMEIEADDNSRRSCKEDRNGSPNSGREAEKVVIDDSGDESEAKLMDVEKEEGELEEGEIDLDSEVVGEASGDGGEESAESVNTNDKSGIHLKEDEVERRLHLIQEALDSVMSTNGEISFEGACYRLQSCLESLREVVLVNSLPLKDALVELFLDAIRVVHSEFCSMDSGQKETNEGQLSRLLSLVKSDPSFLSSEQAKEIEDIMCSLNPLLVVPSTKGGDRGENTQSQLNEKNIESSAGTAAHNLAGTDKPPREMVPAEVTDQTSRNITSEALKHGTSGSKTRGILLPLLDLHKDHDEDSLPSPTRQAPANLSASRALPIADGLIKAETGGPTKLVRDTEALGLHPYETDAVRAVSTYQQKFARSSFSYDKLPSPTPSEDDDNGVDDTSGEVSSSRVGNSNIMNSPVLGRPSFSSLRQIDNASTQGVTGAKNLTVSSSSSTVPAKSSAKSRDPRLRFANPESGNLDLSRPSMVINSAPNAEPVGGNANSRKQRNSEDPAVNGHAKKKLRNGLENSGVMKDVKTGGWLEETDAAGFQAMNRSGLVENASDLRTSNGVTFPSVGNAKPNVTSGGIDPLRVSGMNAVAALPALLKDIAVNPTMLVNLLKMSQQQKLAAEAQQNSVDPLKNTNALSSTNSILGAAPKVSLAPPMVTGILQNPAVTLQSPGQIGPVEELGKIRMKPRDPRRFLHGNALQRSVSSGPEQLKHTTPVSRTQAEDQADRKALPSDSTIAPDTAQQFTKNLKSIFDPMPASQSSTSPFVVSQNLPSLPIPSTSGLEVKTEPSNLKEQRVVIGQPVGVSAPGPLALQCSWGDVDHLFEGYDDQQRAAIQRERARRIEEQRKMFAARKLCLVLDLDHTLLNSAKFIEVDPKHDEILRKKEEQDREKPQRHLFRFAHMGMWTKLRPGIWNFLEKASKLYELHLYTMGNKLYATEMAKVLDPKGVLFAGRVISRGDDSDPFDGDERFPKSKDLEGVLGMESGVVIIDDSVRVWPHNKLNLIVVERYTYFPCSRRQFGLLGPSLLEIDHDERPEDGTLASSLAVIERIHQTFFSHQLLDDVDVRNILAAEQRKILAGCRIVFSRVFPVGEANPHLHPLWQTAEQFGAVCTNQIDEQVTHVVANSLGTDKVNWALSTGRFVVHPGWVEASALLYRRVNEQDFAIKQ